MILKIKEGISGLGNSKNWRFIDNVDEVTYKLIKKTNKQSRGNHDFKGRCFEYQDEISHTLEIYITRRNHTGEIIYTDMSFYILEDNGATIEHVYNSF